MHDPSIPLHYTVTHAWLDTIHLYIFSKFIIKILDANIILNKNVVNHKIIDFIKYYNFNVDLFSIKDHLICLIIYLRMWITSNKNAVNYKILDLFEFYNFDMYKKIIDLFVQMARFFKMKRGFNIHLSAAGS